MDFINQFGKSKIKSFEELENILKKGKADKNELIIGTILEQKSIPDSKYIITSIAIGKEYSDKFISPNLFDKTINIGDELEIPLNAIKIKSFKNCIYIHFDQINKYYKRKDRKIIKDKYKLYNFSSFSTIYTSYQLEHTKNTILSIILKVEQIDIDGKDYYQFKDIFEDKVNILDSSFIDKIEGQNIYYFNYFDYNKEKRSLEPNEFSSITEIDKSFAFDNFTIDNNIIESLVGKIISFDLSNKKIGILDKNEKKISLILNLDLMKKIVLDCDLTFLSFVKINDSIYKYSNFSDIIYNEKTYIKFKVSHSESNYYNSIIIDDECINIENKPYFDIKIKSDDSEKNILDKEIILQKLNEKKELIKQISYNIEVNKDKENNFNIYLGKDGKKSSQYYFQSINENDLKNIKINEIGEKEIVFDNFGNKYKKRITCINFPDKSENDLDDFKLDISSSIKNEGKSIKYLNLIGNDGKKEYLEFNMNIKEKEDDIFSLNKIEESILKLIDLFYRTYYSNTYLLRELKRNEIYKYKTFQFYNLFNNELLLKLIEKEIKNRKFQDNQKDYMYVKKLCFVYLTLRNLKVKYFKYIIDNFIELCESINELLFINRIKILIIFIKEIEYENYSRRSLNLIRLNDSLDDDYMFCKTGYDTFIKILDKLEETMPLFNLMHQFNSPIRKENKTGKNMYSGSILTVQDIKLEIFKNVNDFIFISSLQSDQDSAIYINSKILIVYILNFYKKFEKEKLTDIMQNRLSAAMLIIYFHEYGGHLKTHINNSKDSPLIAYSPNLEIIDFKFKNEDSGFLLEHFFNNSEISIKNFYKNKYSKDLLNIDLYLKDDFNDLKAVLSKIYVCKNESKTKSFKDKKNKGKIVKKKENKEEKEAKKEEKREEKREENEEDEKKRSEEEEKEKSEEEEEEKTEEEGEEYNIENVNQEEEKQEILKNIENIYEDLNYRELFHIFSNLTKKQYDEIKNTQAFKYFKQMTDKKK